MGIAVVGGILLTFAFLLIVPLGFIAANFERRRRSVLRRNEPGDSVAGRGKRATLHKRLRRN